MLVFFCLMCAIHMYHINVIYIDLLKLSLFEVLFDGAFRKCVWFFYLVLIWITAEREIKISIHDMFESDITLSTKGFILYLAKFCEMFCREIWAFTLFLTYPDHRIIQCQLQVLILQAVNFCSLCFWQLLS